MRLSISAVNCFLILLFISPLSFPADRSLDENPELAAFFEAEVARIEQQDSLLRFRTLEEWQAEQPGRRAQLFAMLGLKPLPERTPLQPVTTGTSDETDFFVERLHFQSMPGLYVTGNLYLPKTIEKPVPAVLYVCGHGNVKKNGVSYGSKASYQRHGAWFARNGYACLVIDTLQLGEIEGIHHGTYRYNRWWWNSRGYTPAGVEAWNCIRALDYLQTRSEIDGERLGVTGRSGGGAYSWWIAALDDRIRCAVPVAGITSLRNHVVDGCVEGHCDCMYMLNRDRWDYASVAALVAPRPLLISNTDKDSIFPLEGVVDIHRQVRHIYQLYNQADHLGLQITEGPHKDTQELHIHAFRWMNRFLKNDDSMIDKLAVSFFEPEQLKVFAELPGDERNTTIDETFVAEALPPATDELPELLEDSEAWRRRVETQLRSECFAAWPDSRNDGDISHEFTAVRQKLSAKAAAEFPQLAMTRVAFLSQPNVPLWIDILHHRDTSLKDIATLNLVAAGAATWNGIRSLLAESDPSRESDIAADMAGELGRFDFSGGEAVAFIVPRGIGPHRWIGDEKKQIQIQRRFQLLGMTADGMRIWDIRRAVQTATAACGRQTVLTLHSDSRAGGGGNLLCACAALFEPQVSRLFLTDALAGDETPASILNLERTIDPREIVAVLLLTTPISIDHDTSFTELARQAASLPAWKGQQIVVEQP